MIYKLWDKIPKGSSVIALSRVAEKAFEKADRADNLFMLPHPSGRNRQLNDRNYIKLCLKKCRIWLDEQGTPKVISGAAR